MLLRVSSNEQDADISVVTSGRSEGASAVPQEAELIELVEAVMARDDSRMAAARDSVAALVGGEGLVEAAATIAHFDAITRVADAAGIELDRGMEELTAQLRSDLSINAFAQE